jgi:sarcosine oxidase subunit alpha
VKIYQGYAVAEAIAGSGKKSVVGAKVGRVVSEGKIDSTQERLDCDCICMSVGFTPTYQLLLQAGGKLGYDDGTAMFNITGLSDEQHMAGSVNGSFNLDATIAEGRRAGWRAAKSAGKSVAGSEPEVPEDRGGLGVNHPWPIFPHPKYKEFVDFDEDLQIKDILSSCKEGYYELELVKRFSTVGMGPSQGRHSALATARLVAKYNGRSVADTGVTTTRPPFTAEKVGVVAGRGFEPERLTSMHHRHLEAGAQMMTAGLWWRPAFYGPKAQRDNCIREEVLAVRNNVAVIDVSTLGGLEIRGPDAAEFMNRVYTFAYVKQPTGRSRYVLMTNEAGTVIDDGVACRFREDHYYVTATTGGVDRVYQSLLWWNAQWRLDVDISNVTAAYAGLNIAGPKSREVLAKLTDDVDLSAEAFPYMGLREGHVAGIPARLLRVGFVGELGYEVHVPSSHGEALWDAILEAGKDEGIRPFGVEAQRVLRLEKGHIIVSQDTDAMSYPHEVEMEWAIAKKKPFFVGGRSIQLRERNPSRRKLVGFTLADSGGEMPGESNLVLRDGEKVVGFVTSVARSPSLEKIIGLAFAHVDDAKVGNKINIKLDSGRVVQAEVAHHPFYDPDNQRQEM